MNLLLFLPLACSGDKGGGDPTDTADGGGDGGGLGPLDEDGDGYTVDEDCDGVDKACEGVSSASWGVGHTDDLTGDGRAELLACAKYVDSDENGTGRAYVMPGEQLSGSSGVMDVASLVVMKQVQPDEDMGPGDPGRRRHQRRRTPRADRRRRQLGRLQPRQIRPREPVRLSGSGAHGDRSPG